MKLWKNFLKWKYSWNVGVALETFLYNYTNPGNCGSFPSAGFDQDGRQGWVIIFGYYFFEYFSTLWSIGV